MSHTADHPTITVSSTGAAHRFLKAIFVGIAIAAVFQVAWTLVGLLATGPQDDATDFDITLVYASVVGFMLVLVPWTGLVALPMLIPPLWLRLILVGVGVSIWLLFVYMLTAQVLADSTVACLWPYSDLGSLCEL